FSSQDSEFLDNHLQSDYSNKKSSQDNEGTLKVAVKTTVEAAMEVMIKVVALKVVLKASLEVLGRSATSLILFDALLQILYFSTYYDYF
ncbi:10546_t:CDS:1, partial [Gigaspora rosea]